MPSRTAGPELRIAEMTALRRELHAHPELAGAEVATTAAVADRLRAAGLAPAVLPGGTGLICDLGTAGPLLALRADLDALPIPDTKVVPYASSVPGAAHACGHDLHTAVVLGAGLALADLAAAGELPARVRLIFQPAEEAMWGARAALDAGALDGVVRVLALHADPRLQVGRIGLRAGAVTGAADFVTVTLHGPGGHTARPHMTADLVHALAVVAAEAPAALVRRVDPRAGLRLVWGRVAAGSAPNVIPTSGELAGTLRCLDTATWDAGPALVTELIEALAARLGVRAEVAVTRGVPPCENDPGTVETLRAVVAAEFGAGAAAEAEQSLGGEDFAWMTRAVPGALIRLGTRTPGAPVLDLHCSEFDVDEAAVEIGIRLLVAAAQHGEDR